MKKLSLLLLSILIITFFGCKKDEIKEDNQDPQTYQSKGYIPLKVGSYWIYQTFRVLPSGSDSALNIIDSVYISGTVKINSHTYFVLERTNPGNIVIYVRDSVGYLVDSTGSVLMSEVNFTDTISSKTEYINNNVPLYHASRMMYNEHKQVIVPAGTFDNCIELRAKVKVYYGNVAQPNPFYSYAYYAKNVGQIEYSYRYFGDATMHKVKLIRYYIPK